MPWEDFFADEEGSPSSPFDEEEEDSSYGTVDGAGGMTRSFRSSNLFDDNRDENFIDTRSPESKSYLERAQEPAPSEGMFESYLRRRPDIDSDEYKPSFGRKLGSVLLAAGSGAIGKPEMGITLARQIQRAPYEKAFSEWETEGKYLPTRARLADASRNRELQAFRRTATDASRQKSAFRKAEADQIKASMGTENALLKDQRAVEKEKERRAERAETRKSLESRFNRVQSRLEKVEGEREREKQTNLDQLRYDKAKEKAHELAKEKFPDMFKHPNDPNDYSLADGLDDEDKGKAISIIKEYEDIFRRSFGVK